VRSILPLVGSGSFRKSSPNEGWMDSPSGEFAYLSVPDRREEGVVSGPMKKTHDVFTEIRVWESHDCLERVWA
jgi:hypothetical protein